MTTYFPADFIFERFTERARRVVVLAQDDAVGRGHSYIGTEHLLMGLIQEGEGIGFRVLNKLGVGTLWVSERIASLVGPGETAPTTGSIPFTPRAKRVCELALREALSLGHNYIGTEHVLLGLVRERAGVGYTILGEAGIDAEKVRNEVIRMLTGPGRKTQDPTLDEGPPLVIRERTLVEKVDLLIAKVAALEVSHGGVRDEDVAATTAWIGNVDRRLREIEMELGLIQPDTIRWDPVGSGADLTPPDTD